MRLVIAGFCCLLIHAAKAQVHLQTGAAQFSLPLHAYADPHNRLSTSITLNYLNGNGLKVNEMASSFGTGWGLQFGGEIVRIQNGEADDQYQPQVYNDWTGPFYQNDYYPNGYLNTDPAHHPSIQVKNGAAYVPTFSQRRDYRPPPEQLADREQDVFQFSFNGRTGQFVIGRGGSILPFENTKLKIEKLEDQMSQTIRTKISGFIITDELGISYVFKDRELSEVLKYNKRQFAHSDEVQDFFSISPDATSCSYYFDCPYVILGHGMGQFIVSKWLLTEIRNPLSSAKIHFNYEEYPIETFGTILFNKTASEGKIDYTLSFSKIKGIAKRIISISCSPKESILFQYSALNRKDLPHEKSIDNIQVLYNGVCKYKWRFTLGYTGKYTVYPLNVTAFPEDLGHKEEPYLRLCLLGVQKVGIDGTNESPYEFSYNLGNPNNSRDGLPTRFSYFHDHWGYSNISWETWGPTYNDDWGNLSPRRAASSAHDFKRQVDDPFTIRQPADKKAQNGILQSIKYPTGGKISFEYEQNNVFHDGANIPMGGVRVRRTILHDGITDLNNIVTEYKYLREDGNSSGWGYDAPKYTQNVDVTIYKSTKQYSGINLAQVASTIPRYKTMIVDAWFKVGADLTTNWSFAKELTSTIGSVVASVAIGFIVDKILSFLQPAYKDISVAQAYSDPINWGSGIPFQYSRVETSQVNNGRTIYEFTSSHDYPLRVQGLNFPYSNRPRFASWLYGLPKEVYFYSEGNLTVPVKHISNNYSTPLVDSFVNPNFISQKWSPYRTVHRSIDDNQMLTSTASSIIASDYYYPLHGRIELLETKEYLYNKTGGAAITTKKYYYNGDYQVKKIETRNSKNELVEKEMFYPNDYTIPGAISKMVEKGFIGEPIMTQTFVGKPDGKYLINSEVNEYGVVGSGDIKLIKQHQFESTTPIHHSQVAFSGTQLLPNTNYYKEISQIAYDNASLPLYTLSKTRMTAAIYDYDKKLITANIGNASAADICFTSFEAENKGNWTFESQDIVEDFAPTGIRCYQFPRATKIISSGVLKGADFASWSNQTTYTLSFWSKGGRPFISKSAPVSPFFTSNGITLKKSYLNSTTGWTYYEYEVLNANEISLRNDRTPEGVLYAKPESFQIDELRLYPSNATISTTTYDALIGKTSECDANGRITYYRYDGMGRLKTIRDENWHVVKAYEYHLKTVFYNSAKNGGFTKQGCPVGYDGSIVYYTVPEGKYSSLISKADAEQQATTDLTTNGQSLANAQGTCILNQMIYAEISYENYWNSGSETYADIIVRFYDANGAQFTVVNHNLTYQKSNSCGTGSTSHNSFVNGNQAVLVTNALVHYTDAIWNPSTLVYDYIDCYIDYTL